jgi:histone H3/H4
MEYYLMSLFADGNLEALDAKRAIVTAQDLTLGGRIRSETL